MPQCPVATSVTVFPETVQVVGVADAKLTVRPDEAVAVRLNGGLPRFWLGSGANVMVCGAFVTCKPWVTGLAARYVPLPDCVAVMLHRPTARSVTVLPETVQIDVVVETKLTGRPDDAVAVTANGGALKGRFASGANVMVWAIFVTWKPCPTG